MKDLFEKLLGYERVTVTENERVLALQKGRFMGILDPGVHLLRKRDLTLEPHNLSRPEFTSAYKAALLKDASLTTHLTRFRAGRDEILVILRDGLIYEVLAPDTEAVYWTATGPWDTETVDVSDGLEVAADLALRLTRAGRLEKVASFEVPEGSVGLMSLEGAYTRTLEAGTHRFWGVARKVTVKLVDMRWRSHDAGGQEVLTRDRVSIRVNLAADFRVKDPVKAVGLVKDYEEALHRALQFAFRKTLGALTLDQLLADKVAVDVEVADNLRAEMEILGLEVGQIALKDVILPGEMREILTSVVAAQKEAEANVVRRREETNATRLLLNTAKLMEENPVMLRLKELEALEKIAGKVDTLTVHNGTAGLMDDLVKLRE